MMENVKRMGCGNCGGTSFSIYLAAGDPHFPTILMAECLGCKSTTEISIQVPVMQIEFGENSHGCLSVSCGDGT